LRERRKEKMVVKKERMRMMMVKASETCRGDDEGKR
jgi:hypothetical protein